VIAADIELGDLGGSYDGRAGVALGRVYLGDGNDGARGGTEVDILEGGNGNDNLWGNGGDDRLEGGKDADNLYGGSGADTIRGGQGRDVMTGGSDADLFAITINDSGASSASADHITDFQHGLDKFDFDSPVKFVGSAPYDTSTRSMRYDQATGRLTADVNFDGVTDWMVILDNKPVFTASDLD
jgi:Ca2+-binding RTX toxin-like protein